MSLARLISPAAAAIRSLRASPALATQASKIISPRRFHQSDGMTATLDPQVLQRYLNLDSGGHVLATYIWIDGTGEGLRGKTRTMTSYPSSVEDLPIWNFDGSSTGQASGHDSDVYIHPVSIFKDPFMTGNNCLVMCETYDKHGKPHATNRRNSCMTVMKRAESTEPIFGFEQEYTLLDSDNHPYGWPKNGYVGPQGPYYCAVGTNRVFGRAVVEAHYKACLYAGIKIGGTNAEVMPSQWEYQVGPCMGIDMGDQLWVSRYILHRVAEDFGVVVSLDPKPMPGDWNGAGGHCNFSTAQMRADGGIEEVKKAIEKLSKVHHRHIKLYDPAQGADNRRRLTGHHETAHIGQFLSGVAHRGASIRIPRQCDKDGKGYLEDRRPSSNCDPYLVTEAIIRSSILEDWSDFDWSSFPEEK